MQPSLHLLFFLFLFIHTGLCAQQLLNNIPEAFEAIPNQQPRICHFKSRIKTPAGGHLQGIQGYTHDTRSSFIITGSASSFSYYITAPENGDATLHKIANEPLRHAGGCQLANGKVFTGIEDNAAKDKSDVVMFAPGIKPVETLIKRSGIFKRSTAGAVGALYLNGKYLVAVADWDSRHIDFYRSGTKGLDSVASFSASGKWGSYQSINLLADTAGNIFLIGFCREGKNNRADLFSVINYQLTLLSSRYFECTKGSSFRYTAGIGITPENKLVVITCPRQLKKRNSINIFGVDEGLPLRFR
ncbi:MAG: hypothetical protein AB7G44_00465 [Bacteroidia bacterium]